MGSEAKKYPVRELMRHLEQLKHDRSRFEPFWRDVQSYIVPHRGRFLAGNNASEVNDGSRKDDKIINGAATKALEVMSSGMQSGLTSKAREWFNLGHPNRRVRRLPQVRSYFAALKRALLEAFDRSNLYSALLDVYTEMGAFGTGAMAILPHPDKVFRFRSYTVGSYWISTDARQELDTFFCCEFLTVWAADAPGVNIALNAKATASSQASDSLAAANVTDGNSYNRWGSQHRDPQWIMLDLGTAKTFSCVVLFWEAHNTNYKIEVSNDGQSWKTIHVQKSGQGKIEDIYLKKNVTARYVRLYSEKRATEYGVSLHEIQLFIK